MVLTEVHVVSLFTDIFDLKFSLFSILIAQVTQFQLKRMNTNEAIILLRYYYVKRYLYVQKRITCHMVLTSSNCEVQNCAYLSIENRRHRFRGHCGVDFSSFITTIKRKENDVSIYSPTWSLYGKYSVCFTDCTTAHNNTKLRCVVSSGSVFQFSPILLFQRND